MLRVNFTAYNTYVTDSLFQWDKNRKLVINGLNLPVAPEIRFTNEIMEKSIVRQSKLDDGIITACIPNSLLQYHYTIKAYVGIYENDAFKTLEIIHIPVNPQERPLDYVLNDNDDEVYSFNALDSKVESTLVKYNQASEELQQSIDNYQLARQEFIEGIKEANKSFKLSKIYTSITLMNAGYATDDVPLYGFVLINTGNVNDIDNAKLFVKTETQYDYVAYLIGLQGEKGEPFTYEDFTPEQLEGLRGPQGEKGETGDTGAPGKDGITPTIQDWLGSEPIGSPTKPLYYDGEKFVEYELPQPRVLTLEEASWYEINEISKSGHAKDYFYIGETKTAKLANGKTATFRIIGFDHDDLSDGSGKAGITFEMTDNANPVTSSVNQELINAESNFNTEIRAFIKSVTKKTWSRSYQTVGFYPTTTFCLSISEIMTTTDEDYKKEGERYEYYVDGRSLIKNISGSPIFWWLRSQCNDGTGGLCYITARGSLETDYDSSGKYVFPCFCI